MTSFFPFSWKELLDILLVSFLLHRLYLLFRGTTALQVAVGFFFLGLFSFAAEASGLVLMTRFFQGMAAVAAVAGIVVFRSEIRSVLLHTNPLRFFLGQSSSPLCNDPEEVAKAVFRLAGKRIGALICLENRESLSEFVQEGIELDGRFSAAIVESIFVNQSPVHDGAVIVRDGRILRVGTFLPLTGRKNLPERFGTRHRAAFGLSEKSDAAVLVVSEERGEVSLVYRGELKRVENRAELVASLRESAGEEEKRPLFRNWFGEGFRQAAGLAAVFLLVGLLWNLYLGAGHSLVSLRVPVEFRNVPGSTVVTHDFEEEFAVRISGKNPLVEALQPGQVSAFIDLDGLTAGTHSLTIDEKNFRLPPGLSIEQILPGNVEILLEPRVIREVPVEVVFSDPPSPELEEISAEVFPKMVKISGPSSKIDRIERVETRPVSLANIDSGQDRVTILGRLAALPPSVGLAEGESREIRISVSFEKGSVIEEEIFEEEDSPSVPALIRS